MAFQPINFLNAPIATQDFSGLSNLFKNYNSGLQGTLQNQMMGLQTAAMPYKIRNEMEMLPLQKALLEAQARHQGELANKSGIENRFLPEQLRSNIGHTQAQTGLLGEQTTGKRIENQFAPNLNQAKLQEMFAHANLIGQQSQGKAIENDIMNQTGLSKALADVENTKALAKLHGMNAKQTEQMVNRLESRLNSMKDMNIPEGSIDLMDPLLDKNSSAFYRKEQQAQIQQGRTGEKVLKIVKDLERIQRENPHMATSFTYALENADQDPSALTTYAKRNFVQNKKDLAAVQAFNKGSNELATLLTQSTGQKVTDMFRSMIVGGKPQSGNLSEVNNQIFKRLNEEYQAYPDWLNSNLEAQRNGFYLPADPNLYFGYKNKNVQKLTNEYSLDELRKMEAFMMGGQK